MNAPFQFTPQATEDLDAIWWFIAERSRPGRCRPGGNGNRRYLPAAGETSPDRNPAAGHHASRGALLDRHGIPQLCDCLPARNSSVAGGRRVARQARPKRGSGRAVLTTARATAAERPRARNRAVVHRREADGPNAIWQADHTPLDILLIRPD